VAMPLGMLIYAVNDISDWRTDQLNPRKDSFLFGARPTFEQIRQLPLQVTLFQVPFLLAFWTILGPRALLWFVAAILSTLAYNHPKYGAKDRPYFDVLAQVGYLLVFVLATWMSGRTISPWYVFVFGALFAMHSHLFGQIMDIEPDAQAGRTTTAVVIGARNSKFFAALLLAIEALVALNFESKPYLSPLLALGALGFVFDALFIWREEPYPTWLVTMFFFGWNFLLLLEIGWSYWKGNS
jgi:4-hydroxybenzoate polyprenyltransferase